MFYAIANLTARETVPVEPWNVKGSPDRPSETTDPNKRNFSAWCIDANTQHVFYSAVEGLDPRRRADSDNPPIKLHGLIADYDAFVDDAMIAKLKCEYPPNYISKTISNGARCVWVFAEPVTMSSKQFLAHTLKMIQTKLKLSRMLPGLDTAAFKSYHTYYELGTDWRQLNPTPVPVNLVWQWVYEAGKTYRWSQESADCPEIPLEKVKEEVERKFPGRWQGAFEEGCRGPRFWDPAASNPTSAIVRRTGMQCFSGDKSFVTWAEIFGKRFIEGYEADRIGSVLDDYFYDGRVYWKKLPDGTWHPYSKDDFKLTLKVRHNMATTSSRTEASSEAEKAMYAVQEHKLVAAALPFVHQPEGFHFFKGVRYLNIANCQAMAPSVSGGTDWGDGFPWLADFLANLFEPKEQLKYLLAWWKRFYTGAYTQQPVSGHALFIAGPVGVGKTLLTTEILPNTVGGASDASNYLLGEEKFTSHILSKPIMCVDDTAPATDAKKFHRYSSMVKKIAANSHQLYEAKFRDAGMIEWLGRIVVTCNTDPDSIKVIPSLDISILDKLSLLKCGTPQITFPSRYDLNKIVQNELPFLCRFLLNWELPEEMKGTSRFGVKPYHSEELVEASLQSSPVYAFLELLAVFLQSYAQSAPGSVNWLGTSTLLLSQMANHPEVGMLASRFTGNQIATMLGQLKSKGYPIAYARTNRLRIWRLPLSLGDTNIQDADFGPDEDPINNDGTLAGGIDAA